MSKKLTEAPQLLPDHYEIIAELTRLEDRLYRAKRPISARAINRAKNAFGWESVGDIDMAAKAALRDEANV